MSRHMLAARTNVRIIIRNFKKPFPFTLAKAKRCTRKSHDWCPSSNEIAAGKFDTIVQPVDSMLKSTQKGEFVNLHIDASGKIHTLGGFSWGK